MASPNPVPSCVLEVSFNLPKFFEDYLVILGPYADAGIGHR